MKRILKYIFIILLVSIILFNYNVVLASTIVNNTINNANQSKEDSLQTNTEKSEEIVDGSSTNENEDIVQNVVKNEISEEKVEKTTELKENVEDDKINKSKTIIENGIYKIETILNNKPAFDITDGSFKEKAQIQLWDYLNAEQQKFEVIADKNGYYKIKSVYTGKVLAVENNDVKRGTAVVQKQEKGTDDEKWMIKDAGNGQYNILSKINNFSIDVPDYNAVNGQKIQMCPKNGSEAQKFTFSKENVNTQSISNGDYNINSVSQKGQSFDITDTSKENGTKIQTWTYLGALQQKFNIEYLKDGYYKIISKLSNKALTISPVNGNIIGSNVIQQEYKNLDTQKWSIKWRGENSYSIVSKDGNYAMELKGIGDGAKIIMNTVTGQDNQKFEFCSRRTLSAKKTIENGRYKIESIINNKPAFDIVDGSKKEGAQIQLWDYLEAEQQKFDITCDNNGYYEIKSVFTGKVLAIDNTKASNGTLIIQKTRKGTDDEKWIINKEDNGTYSINSKINNSSIDVPDYNAVNGQKLQLHDYNNGPAQKFMMTRVSEPIKLDNGTYRISMYTNQKISFDIDAGKRENGANLQLWSWAGENSYQQQFKLIYNSSDKTYLIYNINSGKVLDIKNGSYEAGANVWQYEYNGTDAQKWIILKNPDGSYSVKSKLNGLYLDISNGNIADGGNVQVYTGNGTDAQKFNFTKQTDKAIRYVEDGLYQIATKYNNNLVFDITDGSKKDGAKIQLWDYLGAEQEEFKLYYEGGYYYIYSPYSNKVIQAGQNNQVITQETKNSSKDTQKWILQPNGDAYNIISKATGLYIDVVDANHQNGTKLQTHTGNGNIAQLFKFEKKGIYIDENKYPGYKQKITQLRQQHPNWEFELLYTGLDFNTAVTGEYEYANKQANLVYTPTYKGDWIAPNPYVSGTWASASYKGIAYFMDPRNFLNDVDVFQFVDLGNYASSGATKESIQYQVNGTFLNNYAEDLRRICENNNVNPYYIVARLFQEQGRNGSATLEMDGRDGKKYYNPFNIGAVVGNDVATALARAKKEGWDTMVKGLEGGMKIVKSGYIDVKQHTLYLNKFDVNPASGGGFYNHQYMQNLSAAYSEADILRSCYVDTNTLDNKIKFVIPVFENMPTTVSEKPTGQGESSIPSDKGPISVKVVDTDMGLALRAEASTSGNLIERMPTGSVLCSIERLSNGWHKVIAPSGNIGYCSDSNLQIIADETNCNDRVKVETKDNSGTNVRTGPGTSYPIIRAVGEGTVGTRIMTNKYNYEGYSWDIVVFEDGTKGFVATNYLVKID